MRLRNTLVLALLFVLLGAYLYFYELKKERGGKGEKLLSFKEEEVESLILTYPEQEIRIRKESSGRWQMTHPLEAGADESTVSGILSALTTSEVERTIEKKPGREDLQAFGLDQPKVKVSITLQKGKSLPSILVGEKSPVGDSAYVKRESEPSVLLTNAILASSLQKRLYDFRDKKILELKEDEVKRLTLSGEKGDLALVRRGRDWFLDKPKPYRADPTEVKGMLSTLRNMSAQDFLEEAPRELKKYGLDRPRLRVTLFLGEKEGQREILLGNKREGKEEVYLVLDSKGTVYTVYESVFKGLNKDLTSLRDKEIFAFAPDSVAKIHIQSPKESFILAKDEKEDWRVEAPSRQRAKEGAVAEYLETLSRLRVKAFAEDELKEPKKYGLDRPALKISLGSRDGKNLGALLVGDKIRGDYYAKREDNPTVVTIEEFSYRQLNRQLADFLEQEKKESLPPSGAKK